MNIENMTLKQLQELGIELSEETILKIDNMLNDSNSHWEIGENYLIRTVTMTSVGKLKKVTNSELVLTNASWIADTGRYHDAIKDGFSSAAEIEPYIDDIIINRSAIVDATKYRHELPSKQQ